jgi:predicted O-methyltransferase YrrM
MKKIIFSLLRRGFYFFNNYYFNFFSLLKTKYVTNNKKKDFINSYESKVKKYKSQFPEIYKNLDLKKFKRISVYTGITLPEPDGDFNFGALLHYILKNYLSDKKEEINILEIGTARGFSSLCMALALDGYKYPSKILTLDVISNDTDFFQKTFLGNKKISRKKILDKLPEKLVNKIIFLQGDSLSDLKKLYIKNINFCYLDAEHNRKYLKNEINFVKKFQKSGDIIVFDDYDYKNFPEVYEVVNEFIKNEPYEVVLKDLNHMHKIIVLKKC